MSLWTIVWVLDVDFELKCKVYFAQTYLHLTCNCWKNIQEPWKKNRDSRENIVMGFDAIYVGMHSTTQFFTCNRPRIVTAVTDVGLISALTLYRLVCCRCNFRWFTVHTSIHLSVGCKYSTCRVSHMWQPLHSALAGPCFSLLWYSAWPSLALSLSHTNTSHISLSV